MIHDPLCPFADRIEDEAFRDIPCGICNLIAKVREDERRRWDGQSVVLASTIKQEGEQG